MTTHGQPAVANPATETDGTVAAPAKPSIPAARSAEDPSSDPTSTLVSALTRLRDVLTGTEYPLLLPTADPARRAGAALVGQLDDYLLPRLARLDAPLLVVVGGSTGAGKSTLVNSLVRAPVSPAGVLRPTTRAPVLVSHPADTSWFRQAKLLPGLARTALSAHPPPLKPTQLSDEPDPHTLRLVAAPALSPGLALLDAPDIDSVVATNRALAHQLLAAADMWLFVTTAARYADAVPWDLLQNAAYRGTVLALVLDRVPPEAAEEVIAHLTELLGVHGFSEVPLFVLPETLVDGQGLLPEEVMAPLGQWLAGLAADTTTRAAVVRQTVDGALAAIPPVLDVLARAADDQATATTALTDRVAAAYRTARRRIDQGVRDGALLRGEALARWQEFVSTGELVRTLEARLGRLRDRVAGAVNGRRVPGRDLRAALESGLVSLIEEAAAEGAELAYSGWQTHPAGAALLRPDLARPSGDLPQRVERLARDWRRAVLDLVRAETGDRRAAAYPVNATGLLVMVAVATGTTVATQVVHETVFGEPALRTLAWKARDDLQARVDALLDAEAGRFLRLLPMPGLGLPPADRLREAAARVEQARTAAGLTTDPVVLPLPEDTRD